jgi:hypothetical protein
VRVHKGAHRIPDLLCRFEQMPVVQVRIPGRGLNIGVPEETSDHRQCLFVHRRVTREGVAQVVDANAG